MALRIQCPSCRTVNEADAKDRGRKIRCEECDALIRVPDRKSSEDDDASFQHESKVKTKPAPVTNDDDADDDDYDEEERRPRKKKKKPARGLSTTAWLLIGGGVGLFLLLITVAGVSAVFLVHAGARNQRQAGADRQRINFNQGQNPNVLARGKMVFDQRGFLGEADPPDPTPHLKEVDARMKIHQVMLQAGKTYVITMDSNEIDSYLRLESPTGARLAEDDDSGGNLNSRIVFRVTQTGMHRVIATSWDGGFGAFQLKVQEAD